jgi:hypothetical protein
MWQALQSAEWVTTLATTRWVYGLVSVVHYSAVFVCVGTFVVRDWRILGIGTRNRPLSPLAAQLRPWTWIGFAAVVVSGFLLFAIQAAGFAAATPFRLKMLVVALAVVSALVIERTARRWEQGGAPVTIRLVALLAIALWLAAILVSVEIPALTGLG